MARPGSEVSDRATRGGAGAGRAAPLQRAVIVERAVELAERHGPAAMTLRRLGEELGVDGTAFYRHFRDKDELVLAMGDLIGQWELERAGDAIAAADDWRGVLRAVAGKVWRMSRRYPAVFSMTYPRTTGGETERRIVELLLGALGETGMDERRTVLAYRTFVDVLLGLAGTDAVLLSMDAKLQEKDATAWSRVYAVLPGETNPATRRHADELVAVTEQQIFDCAVEAMITGIEAMVRAGA